MLEIHVVSYGKKPLAESISAQFDASGGDIGRDSNNRLYLPDPDRHISRVQASVEFKDGQFVIVDRGSVNPVVINGSKLGRGNTAPLHDGDQLTVGPYALSVSVKGAPQSAGAAPKRTVEPAPIDPAPHTDSDPLGLGANGQARKHDPFDLFSGDNGASREIRSPPKRTERPARRAPADATDDPFKELLKPQAEPEGEDVLGTGKRQEQSGDFEFLQNLDLDAVLGLDPSRHRDAFKNEPVAREVPESGPALPDLSSLGLGGGRRSPSSEERTANKPDQPERRKAFDTLPPTEERALKDLIVSWELDQAEPAPTHSTAPPVKSDESDSLLGEFEQPDHTNDILGLRHDRKAGEPVARVSTGFGPKPGPRPPDSIPQSRPAPQDELLGALLSGLGLEAKHLPDGLTKANMALVGRLLRKAVEGTWDLLQARKVARNELGTEQTIVMNSPLKFAPDAAHALKLLLGPHDPGYMDPVHAMTEAYDDLRAHNIGMTVGIRAALGDALLRFDPQGIEKRLTKQGFLERIVPAARDAKLWELFTAMYAELSQEAREDFDARLKRKFAEAYDEAVASTRKSLKQN